MIKLTQTSVVSNPLATHLNILPLLTVAALAFVFVSDVGAVTRSRTTTTTTTSTDGAIDTPYSDHGISTKCSWENFQGVWEATPGDPSNSVPTQVTHFVGDKNDPTNVDYAICGGFDTGSVPVGKLTNPDGTPNDVVKNAPYGWGYFYFDITYESATTNACIEDPNSGIGNNCIKFTDNQNKKHGGGDLVPTAGASLACADNYPAAGTTLTYKFSCAAGVTVTGFLTLAPTINGVPQAEVTGSDAAFTKCGPERVAAGQCSIIYGGFPLDRRGNLDTAACLEAFPDADMPNGLNTNQLQHLGAGEILLYQEVSNEGSCDTTTNLPTGAGAAVAAYSRYCTSDIDTFTDNVVPNVFSDDPTSDAFSEHGFDNELRACYKRKGSPYYHTGVQDVERIELADVMVDAGPTFNLNCSTGDNTDSGIYKVKISDQATLLAGRIDVTPLSDAPTLEGVSPTKASITTNDFGVDTLELVYPTCPVLSATIIDNNNLDSSLNNTNVTLELIGQTVPTEASLDQAIKTLIEIKVNGL